MLKMIVSSFYNTIIDYEEAIPTSTVLEIDRIRNKGISFSVALIVAGFIVLIFGNGIQPQRGGMPSGYSGLKRNDNLFLSANKMECRYKETNNDMTIALAGLTCIVAGLVLLYA